jgi:hypothetical protein
MPSPSRIRRRLTAVLLAPLAVLFSRCSDSGVVGPEDAPNGVSRAFGIWSPGPNDTCTPEVHDRYAVVGPDGKLYPTWHPPTDPSGCTFGHEHGRDPRGSDLFGDVGPIPFGYANEQLDTFDPTTARHEDHVGHKVEWGNNLEMRLGDAGGAVFDVRCDVLVKMHQGTHSKDAFTNNLHELAFHAVCSDGTRLHMTILSPIGDAGEFVRSCDGEVHVEVGPPTPLNSPDGGGRRLIPDRSCVEEHVLVPEGERSSFGSGLRESWQLSHSLRTAEGRGLASIDPYFNVQNPSRFHDPALPNGVGRPIDVCYEVTTDGRRAQGGLCDESTAEGTITGIPYDDPRSLFNGADRDMDINSIRITNADGPEVWYTDPFGRNGQRNAFPGSIRQFIARIDNSAVTPSGPSIGRDYGGPGTGVHAPN